MLNWTNEENPLECGGWQCALIEVMTKKRLIDNSKVGARPPLPSNEKYFKENKRRRTRTPDRITGGLMFIARMIRPEISIQVNPLGRWVQEPSVQNLQGAHKVLRYLYSTRQKDVRPKKPSNPVRRIYAGASYGDKEESSRSQTGVLIALGQQPVGWYSRRQDVVALSITEAEYTATAKE